MNSRNSMVPQIRGIWESASSSIRNKQALVVYSAGVLGYDLFPLLNMSTPKTPKYEPVA